MVKRLGVRVGRKPLCSRLVVVAGLLVLAGATAVAQQPPPYFSEMPTAERVITELKVPSSKRQSAARTEHALNQLATVLSVLSGAAQKRPMSPAEAQRFREYREAAKAMAAGAEATVDMSCQGDDCERYLFPRCSAVYTFNPAATREVLDRFFSPEWQARYASRFSTGMGTVWRDAVAMPRGSTLEPTMTATDKKNCQDGGGPSLWKTITGGGETGGNTNEAGSGLLATLLAFVVGALSFGFNLVWSLAIPIAIVWYVFHKFTHSRRRVIRKSNREAMSVFGSGAPAAREHAIIEAFDSPDYTFKYAGVNRDTGQKMRFELMRNIKSFRHGELEAMRFAYLAYNRGLLDEEKFHWYRVSAIYGGGATDPSDWKFLGLFSFLRTERGAIEQARAAVASFVQANGGTDVEGQALAMVTKLAHDHPNDDLFRDMRRRFVDGVYWLTKGEMKRSAFAPSASPFGVSFGTLDGSDAEVVYAGDGSIMTVAPPRSGKTQCNVFPNLLRWPGPAVVLDVKGEIYDGTSRWRQQHVGPVIRFSPLDTGRTARFNPLAAVRSDSMNIWEDSLFLADMILVPPEQGGGGGGENRFWNDRAREVLRAVIADVVFWNAPDDRPMAKVVSIINRNGWAEFIDRLRKNPEIAAMRDEGASLAAADPKTIDGILQTAKSHLGAWTGERIALATRASDWQPLDLRNGTNPTIYICIKPNEIDTYASLLRVVIAQHIRALTSDLPPRGAPPILFVLDELPRLRSMPPIETALETGAAYGIRLWMFAQSVGQMRKAYVNADGMIGSCAVRSYMNPSLEDGTAEAISKQIGYRKGEEHHGKGGVNTGAAPRLVIEATQLGGPEFANTQIVLGVGSKPAKVHKRFAHQDERLTALMGAAPISTGPVQPASL